MSNNKNKVKVSTIKQIPLGGKKLGFYCWIWNQDLGIMQFKTSSPQDPHQFFEYKNIRMLDEECI